LAKLMATDYLLIRQIKKVIAVWQFIPRLGL
jgi:hypothetical protein